MRNWPTGMLSLVNSDPTEIIWAELYTVSLATPNYPSAYDQFNQGAISANWTNTNGSFAVPAGTNSAACAVAGFASMFWNNTTFLQQQRSQVMLTKVPTGSGLIGPAVAMNSGVGVTTMYACYIKAAGLQLIKLVSGTATIVASLTYTPKIFDIVEIVQKPSGLVQASLNGNVVMYYLDGSPLPTGQIGIVGDTTTSGAVTNWVGKSIGQQYMWTNWDAPVTLNGETWQPNGVSPNSVPLITRSRLSFTKGTEVGELEMTWADDGSTLINGIPLMQALARKTFDAATVDLSLAASVPGGSWQGPGTYFFGRFSTINPGKTSCKIIVKDKREEMAQNLPRKVVQQGCGWTLFDSGCTLNRNSFASTGTVAAGSNKSTILTNLTQSGPVAGPAAANSLSHISGHAVPAQTYYVRSTYITAQGETIGGPEGIIMLGANELLRVASPASATGALSWNCYVSTVSGDEQLQNDAPISIGTSFTMPDYQQSPSIGLPVPTTNQTGYFDLGYIVWLTGANAGTVSAVRSYLTGGVINFYVPLANAVAAGDTFTAYAGCDKQQATCQYKFNNLINFGGTPYIPPPETTV